MKKLERLFLVFVGLIIANTAFGQDRNWDEAINDAVTPATEFIFNLVFYPWTYGPNGDTSTMPYVIILLLSAATIFTLYFGFINIRKFPLAINVVRGKYDDIEGSDEPLGKVNVNVVDGDIKDTIKIEADDTEASLSQRLLGKELALYPKALRHACTLYIS